MTDKITMTDIYKTVDGQPVRVLCTDRPDSQYPVIAIVGEAGSTSVEGYTSDGFYNSYKSYSSKNLIKVGPYDNLQIDDKVVVRDNEKEPWAKRHFAGVNEDGKALAWRSGYTSFTSKVTIDWVYCEAYDPTNPEHVKAGTQH